MRDYFLLILAFMVGFTQYMNWRRPSKEQSRGLRHLIWVGTLSQEKPRQVLRFRSWLKENNYGDFDVHIDAQNRDISKIVIQATSGKAGDVFDAYGSQVQYFREMGILGDFEPGELAKISGVPDSERFAAYTPTTDEGGREYAVPFHISCDGLLVNYDVFKHFQTEPPGMEWGFAAFEALGKAFMKKANANPARPNYFFVNSLGLQTPMRSCGISIFNETLTGPALGRGTKLEDLLGLFLKWTYEDRILPTAADLASLAQEDSSFNQPAWQLFAKGHFAMISGSRYILMPLREVACSNELGAVLPPHGGYPNSAVGARFLVVYKGSAHRDEAVKFAAYLRSEDYSRQIAEGGDNLPPIPKYLSQENYLRPSKHPNEWRLNAGFREAALRYGIGAEETPFALTLNCEKAVARQWDAAMGKAVSPREAVAAMVGRIQSEITGYVKRHPEKKPAFEAALKRQNHIDGLLVAGKKIPLALVDNVFLKRYYRDKKLGE